MKPNYVQKVTNWGNFPVVEKEMRSNDSVSKIKDFVQERNEVIARGNGRCYGDASLGEHIFSTKRLNKFIAFDRLNGVIECESGVLLSEVLEVAVPQGFFLYVTPGPNMSPSEVPLHPTSTVKTTTQKVAFSECVIEFKLIDENSQVITCSREEKSG